MKKAIFIAAAVGITFTGIAQDKYVTTANVAFKSQNYDEAKENIDKALSNPETKEKPKALFAKAQIYLKMQEIEKYKSTAPYREAAQALYKLAEVKGDFEKGTVDQLLLVCAANFYNDGVRMYNDKKFTESTEMMKNVIKIHDIDQGKRFEKIHFLDTPAANAYQTMANSVYFSGKYEESIPLLLKVKNNDITRTASVYACLIDAYNKTSKTTEANALIAEARKAFPNDVTIRNYELNYFITSGKQDELLKKLEEAAAKEPENSDIIFNLGTTYLGMANPKDGKKPANAADLVAKAEDAFTKAVKIAPDNAGYNYNFGALYFNQATDFNDQMNAITGTSDADQKKYDGFKASRDAMFGKSMPYFEKAYSVLLANENNLKGEDMKTFKQSILALKEVYARQSKLDKSKEMKTKYESLAK